VKVAIVHDYLNQAGGSERVVAVLHRMFPDAPIFTTIFDKRAVGLPLAKADVRVSWMQGLPKWKRHFRRYMPLYPFAVRSFDLRGYDVVITSSSAFAKGVRVPPSALHLCYCYTPMRWAWSFDQYVGRSALSPSARAAARLTLPALRRWDTATARNVDRFIAISTEVSARILAATSVEMATNRSTLRDVEVSQRRSAGIVSRAAMRADGPSADLSTYWSKLHAQRIGV
jgi:hypothetical protein